MEDQREIVLDTPYWTVILMEKQLYLGRCVIVLKRSCGHLSQITSDEMMDFFEIVKKMEALFKKTFGAIMFNWCCLMNNAYQVSPAEPQVHWHFRPRYDKPVEVAGQTFIDPNFGHHYLDSSHDNTPVTQEILNQINQALQKNIV